VEVLGGGSQIVWWLLDVAKGEGGGGHGGWRSRRAIRRGTESRETGWLPRTGRGGGLGWGESVETLA
jgi:hypothetical protein